MITPRVFEHRQPRVPTLGHVDEADPRDFDRQIELATAHGVDGFLFDIYWYDDGPYLQRARAQTRDARPGGVRGDSPAPRPTSASPTI